MIIIVKYKTSYYIFSCTFNLTFTLQYIGTLYYISSLTLFTVFGIISLFFTLYINSFLIPFILLQSPLKHLLLLRFLVCPLLPKLLVLLSLKSLISQLLQLSLLVFLYSTKVHQLRAILWFLYLLWYSIHRCCLNISLTGSFLLVNSIIYFNGLINKSLYIFHIFY